MSGQEEAKVTEVSKDEVIISEIDIPGGSSFKLSAIETLPEKLTQALSEFFKQHKPVRRAFLVLAQEDKDDQSAVMLVGLEIKGELDSLDELIHQAGTLACEYLQDNESIDFCLVNEDEKGISHFITEHIQPFYQRRLGGWLRDSIPVKNSL